MALTVFETAEQLQPCNPVEQGGDAAGKVAASAVAEKAAVMLKETDHGGDDDDDRPERGDVWNMVHAQKPPGRAAPRQAPYVHRRVWSSSSLLMQKSLEICTESLGSETGSDGFSDADDGAATDRSCPDSDDEREEGADEVAARAPPPCRAFPPPLPSLARRTVGALEMRQHRSDGRLVVQAVPVPSPTLFRAKRRGGRLLLSFADAAAADEPGNENRGGVVAPEQEADGEDEDEEEEEVEVVDRGTVVEFKVSTQPQPRSGCGPRVHRSALVINKFVGAEPAATCDDINDDAVPAALPHPPKPPRRSTGSTTTAIAALAAASALSATAAPPGNGEDDGVVPGATFGENKLLMTAKRRCSKEELLKHMRRCGQLSGKLFFWEPRIATSS